MNQENKTCQNCKKDFTIEPEDFAFYEKIKVPPPTFCPECRLQRRMAFRNERTLYKRKCEAPGHSEELVSVFSADNKQRVYDHKAWWGDDWDAQTYSRDFDFSKTFFSQFGELLREVPDIALLNINPVNSDYCSITEGNKNCYLVIGGDFNENSAYSAFIFNSKECLDTYWIAKSEYNYETVDCIQCSKLMFSRYCEGCYDSAFLLNCRNCHDCFGCVNLVNKSYQIFNQQYSKEEYKEKMAEIKLGNYKNLHEIKERFQKESAKFPRRFAHAIHAVNSTGDNLEETKNCKLCFDVADGAKDSSYIWLAYSSIANCLDCDHSGLKSEDGYESSSLYPGSRAFFSRLIISCHDVQYSYNCHNSSNLFGCVGLRNKKFCILNKQYSEEEYRELVPKIIEQMNTMPYVDKVGRVYKYGEFFPVEISPFAYNETVAQELVPLTKVEVEKEGYAWREPEVKEHKGTVDAKDLPDEIKDVKDSILEETISCEHGGNCTEQCTKAFRLTKSELDFYRKMNLPLPRFCHSCRHYQRISQRNPLKLWPRECMCGGKTSGQYANTAEHFHGDAKCSEKFETSYSPDRPEMIYCEQCYQAEVS